MTGWIVVGKIEIKIEVEGCGLWVAGYGLRVAGCGLLRLSSLVAEALEATSRTKKSGEIAPPDFLKSIAMIIIS
jgi:hypothetical protein